MKIFLRSIAFVVMMLVAAVTAQAKDYVNGIDANYPPFAYIDEKTG